MRLTPENLYKLLKSNSFAYSIKQDEKNSSSSLEIENTVILKSCKPLEEETTNMSYDGDADRFKLQKIDEIVSSSSSESSGDNFNDAHNSTYFSVSAYDEKNNNNPTRHVNYEVFDRESNLQNRNKILMPKQSSSNIPIFEQNRIPIVEQKQPSFTEPPFTEPSFISPHIIEQKRPSFMEPSRPFFSEKTRPSIVPSQVRPSISETRQSISLQKSNENSIGKKASISAFSSISEMRPAPSNIKRRMITEIIGNIGTIFNFK
jgi:hypothetical protein